MPARPTRTAAVLAVALLVAGSACRGEEDPSVAFVTPDDGAAIAGTVDLAMTADGITIEEAGDVHDGAGHFHVIADAGCAAEGEVIPKDADHVHLGQGQDTATIYLEAGEHELCLQAGDGEHHALAATDEVTVEVGLDDVQQWCDVIGEVDRMFEEVDGSSDELAVKQVGYENIRRLLSQLSSAIDLVDAGARADVHAALAFAANVTTAFTTADDEADVERALQPIFEAQADQTLPGADYVLDTCGIEIDG